MGRPNWLEAGNGKGLIPAADYCGPAVTYYGEKVYCSGTRVFDEPHSTCYLDLDRRQGFAEALYVYARLLGPLVMRGAPAEHGIDRLTASRHWRGETTPKDRDLLAVGIADLTENPP